MDGEALYTALWRSADGALVEHCHLRGTRSGWAFDGVLVGTVGGDPSRLTYRVSTDRRWRTGLVSVTYWQGGEKNSVRLNLGPDGVWQDLLTGNDLSAALNGCTDIDLGFTPATNTIPIQRLGLAIDESREVLAAWVRFPALTVEPLPQRYTRLAEGRYLYESGPTLTEFSAEITVDEAGLVTAYPGGWTRLDAPGPPGGGG